MKEQHWSDEEQLAHLYGVGPQDGHLEICAGCRERLVRLRSRREALRATVHEVPEELLAAQRRSIRTRLTHRPRLLHLRPLASLAGVVVFAILIFWFRHSPEDSAQLETSDAKIFERVYSEVYSPVPRAVDPVRSLFEVSK